MSSHLLLSSVLWDQKTKLKPRCGLSHRSGVDSTFLFIQCLQFHWPPTEMLQATFPATKSNPNYIHSQEMLSDLKVRSFFLPVLLSTPWSGREEWVSRREKQEKKPASLCWVFPGSTIPVPPSSSPAPPCPTQNDQFSTDQVLRGRTERWLPE